jgi:MoaA/NifB/PqqE/SkfB family radical SAM enzyme
MTRKKEIMPLKLFEKVLQDYSDMGGGKLSLTPKQGDIFFDKFLLNRLDLIKKYPKISGISVTTNAILSDQLTDQELKRVIDSFERIHISIYGIDEEEYSLMTQRDTYNRMLKNVQRIISLIDNVDSIIFGFRFLKLHSSHEVEEWIMQHFHKKINYGETNIYMDWGGSINSTNSLPFQGIWRQRKEGQSQCLIPLSACMIYSNGDVSFCSCNDFDIKDEFLLGNISKKSLTEIINSPKNRQLWSSPTNLPVSCKKCVSYRPFSDVDKYSFMFEKPIDFIGG